VQPWTKRMESDKDWKVDEPWLLVTVLPSLQAEMRWQHVSEVTDRVGDKEEQRRVRTTVTASVERWQCEGQSMSSFVRDVQEPG